MDSADLFDSPDLFLVEFRHPNAHFVRMDREAYSRSVFCDSRICPRDPELVEIPIYKLTALLKTISAPVDVSPSYIFHMAHCGSTLLANALDLGADNLVCREPFPLRQLAVEIASRFYGQKNFALEWNRRLDLVCALLSRAYNPDGAVILKANVPVNFIIPQLLERTPESRSIFLYFSFDNYMAAVLRTETHRNWVASVYQELQHAIQFVSSNAVPRNVAQAAACLWYAQVSIYNQIMAVNPNTVSLDAEEFFCDPQKVLRLVFDFFGQSCSDEQLCGILNGDLFGQYSKTPGRRFNNSARIMRRAEFFRENGPIVEETRRWILEQIPEQSLPVKMLRPLTGVSGPLLETCRDYSAS